MAEKAPPRKLGKGKIIAIVVVALAVIAVAAYLLTADMRAYSQAVELEESGAYAEAIAVYETIPDYQDAQERIDACAYQLALSQEEAGDYAAAQQAFAALGDYADAAEHANACAYQLALSLEETGSAEEAAGSFLALGDYQDSAARAEAIQGALTLYAEELARVQAAEEGLDAALESAETLLAGDETPLDAELPAQLQAAIDAGRAAKVELPQSPVTLGEVEAATEALSAIDYTAAVQALADATKAWEDSVAAYARINAPEEAFVVDRLSRVPEIVRIAAATEENDPNNGLGKEGGYTAQVYFASSLVSEAYAYLSEDDLINAGTECGGSIEVYATPEAAQQRDDYLAAFDGTILASGSHTVAGTLVVRVSGALSASEQQAFTQELIQALTTAEPGPVVEREEAQSLASLLTVEEIGFSMADGGVQYAAVLHNGMENTTVLFPQVRISFYDAQGGLLDVDEMVFNAIYPGQDLAWAGTLWDMDELPASAKAEVTEPEVYDLTDGGAYIPLEVRNASIREDSFYDRLIGEVYNPNDYDVPYASVTVLYRDGEGKLVAGDSGYCDFIAAGGTAPFEIYLTDGLEWDSYELSASAD